MKAGKKCRTPFVDVSPLFVEKSGGSLGRDDYSLQTASESLKNQIPTRKRSKLNSRGSHSLYFDVITSSDEVHVSNNNKRHHMERSVSVKYSEEAMRSRVEALKKNPETPSDVILATDLLMGYVYGYDCFQVV